MHFLRSLSLVTTLGLAAVNVQAYFEPHGVNLARLPARDVAPKLYQRHLEDLYERELEDLYARELEDLYARDLEALYRRGFEDLYKREDEGFYARNLNNVFERDLSDLPILPRGLSRPPSPRPASPRTGSSRPGSPRPSSPTCSGSRTPSPNPGYTQVKMGEAKIMKLPTHDLGIETTGICGCTGVAVIGPSGIAVAHVGAGDRASVATLAHLAAQVGSGAHAVIYAPKEHGALMDPAEVDGIKHALGHITATVHEYEFDGTFHALVVSKTGAVRWAS